SRYASRKWSGWSGTACRSNRDGHKFDSYWSTAICGRFPARSTSLRCPTAKLHSVFGCGDASSGNAESVLAFSTPVSEAAYTQAADRLRHSDALNRDLVDWLR